MAFYGQHPDTAAIIGMAVIASGIVIMNLFSKMGSEESEETPANRLIQPHPWTKKSPTNKKGIAYV
jgi:small multidrug resistance pump